ncbi:MAG: hypothetical protein JWN07_1505 [Hyphomicrobiales bacterium]|nr:hypothetical protein [Hyphomicrobiales bacterium]
MSESSRLTPARLVAEHLSRARAHADIAAMVRESLEALRRSERALEEQLGDLRCYLGHEGVATDLAARAN